jgi:hypothetical protein
MEKRRELRVLTPQQQSEVNAFYKLMAVAMARNTEDNVVLARNQYVEATICELLETVADKLLLLAAWVAWFQTRDNAGTLTDVQWHVTQFQRELDGALAAVEDQCAKVKQFGVRNVSCYGAPVEIAHRLLQGGAR